MKPTTPFANNIHRKFRPDGKVVARRPVTIGREYAIGEEIPAALLEPRQRWMLWEQAMIDTPESDPEPSEAELERLTAPAVPPPPPKSQSKQQASSARR